MHYLSNTNSDLHFMVVSDNDVTRRFIVQLLKELGYLKVSEASDGEMALRSFKSARIVNAPINFLITDCAMPLMDGLELIQQVRADEQLNKVPLLMVAADATRDDIIDASQAGADDYLIKPFTAGKLKTRIDLLLMKYAIAV